MPERELSIKHNMLWNSFGSLVNLGCQWLMTVLIVRLANGYEDAGIFSLAISVYGIFGTVAQYRMYTYQVSDVRNENHVGEYLAFRVITSAGSLLLCMAYSIATCSPDSWLAIFLYGLYKSVALVVDVLHACDQRHSRMDYIGISLALQGVLSLLLFVAVYFATDDLELSLGSMIIAVVLVGVLFDLPHTRKLEKIRVGISRKKVQFLLLTCLSIVAAGMIASATPAIPRQYLAFTMGNEALGAYASVAAPVAVIQMGASYVYNPLLGYFSRSFFNKDRKGFCSLLVRSSALISVIGCCCAIILAVVGEPLLVFVFGESIREYVYLLLPLVAFAVVTGYLWFLNDLLITIRDFPGTVAGSVVAFFVAAACVIPMVDFFGMNGVTFAGIVSALSGIAIMLFMLMRRFKGRFDDSGVHDGDTQ